MSLNPNFKEANVIKPYLWVFPYLSRSDLRGLSSGMARCNDQKLNGRLLEVRSNFSEKLMKKFSTARIYRDVSPCMFLNMDEMAVFFKASQKLTVHFQE